MSGPQYPPGPQPGSNSIGTFAIGISPIGSIIPFNYWSTVLSQYANSSIITALVGNFDTYLDQTANLDAFYDYIFNVATAQGYGLNIWGAIVGVSRALYVPNAGQYFGFNESGSGAGTFGQSAFNAGAPATDNYLLSDSAYRTLIYAKALANICDGSVPAINKILMTLFLNRGNAYVTDQNPFGGPYFGFQESTDANTFGQAPGFQPPSTIAKNMTIYYVFDFALTPVEQAIVEQSGVLPKSTGVAASVVQNIPS